MRVRFPVEPLLALYRAENAGDRGHVCRGLSHAARELGLHRRTLDRWRRHGIPERRADELACSIGMHPLELWPREYAQLVRETTEGT